MAAGVRFGGATRSIDAKHSGKGLSRPASPVHQRAGLAQPQSPWVAAALRRKLVYADRIAGRGKLGLFERSQPFLFPLLVFIIPAVGKRKSSPCRGNESDPVACSKTLGDSKNAETSLPARSILQMSVPNPVSSSTPIPELLLALAPIHLPNHRHLRYVGDDSCVALEGLAESDQVLLRSLYQALTKLLFAIADSATNDAQKWQAVELWQKGHDLDALIDEVREIGLASHVQASSEELAKAMHDVRGGALSALLGRLQMLAYLPRTDAGLKLLFVLTRDHLKIMRNALTGLDEARRDADRRPKAHGIRLMLEKWHESVVGPQWGARSIQMVIDCRYDGPLTECCLESAAVDRIFYNLAANACRYAADERLEMAIFPVPEPPGECLRFVLSNEVSAADTAHLRALIPARNTDGPSLELPRLFDAEVSSTGSGFGLTVVADFVAGAFGLRDREEALRERYVGAVLDGPKFRVWFHWPMVHDDLPPKLDDYRHPQESLSEP